MLIVMRNAATEADIKAVEDRVMALGFRPHAMPGAVRTAICVLGNDKQVDGAPFEAMTGVREVIHVTKPYKLVGREFNPQDTVVPVGPVCIGDGNLCIMAGPCAVEDEEQIVSTARFLAKNGAAILRGGAFKPRTSPYAFQGLGLEGLKLLAAARDASGLPVVTEVIDERSLELALDYVDMLQIGARNMQNFSLLKLAGRTNKPVLLKRGMSATVKDLLMSAEYIMSEGNDSVVLCERGIRTFSDASRNTLDLCAVPYMKQHTHLPVLADPSHAMGVWDKVLPVARAAVAVGADALMIEVHPNPAAARSDGPQSLTFDSFAALVKEVRAICAAMNRSLTEIP